MELTPDEMKILSSILEKLKQENISIPDKYYSSDAKNTRTIRISSEFYEIIRRIAYEERTTQTKVINKLIGLGLSNSKFVKYLKE